MHPLHATCELVPATAARPTPFKGEAAVTAKPRNRGKRPNGEQRYNEAKAKAAGQEWPG